MLPEYLRTIIHNEGERMIVIMDTYQSALYSEVSSARWVGYASSVTRRGAPDWAKVTPNPITRLCNKRMLSIDYFISFWGTHRAPMNMPTVLDAACSAVAPHMITAPINMAARLPNMSLT